jgi:hypothetical protein
VPFVAAIVILIAPASKRIGVNNNDRMEIERRERDTVKKKIV